MSSITEDEWRPVQEYEGTYEVSQQGRVRSLDRLVVDARGRTRKFTGRVLYTVIHPSTRRQAVLLCLRGHKTTALVGSLVLEAFVGPRPKRHYARHINGDPTDARFSNLCWARRGAVL